MPELPTGYEHDPNFSRGLAKVDLSEFGPVTHGTVRDICTLDDDRLIIATTDRVSAFDRIVGTIPGKGEVLNTLSAYWFEQTAGIIPNHVLAVPHPNVLIARRAETTLLVEVIVRRFMAKSSTSTSVYDNYIGKGRRTIYGIEFPDGLAANQELPMGTIITPTTKAEEGHDLELTDEAAEHLVGEETWATVKQAALDLFERGRGVYGASGLLFVDTKYEFGRDKDGKLMLIDEVHTPDSSRLWLAATYDERFQSGQNPETFDKELLRRWLKENGFTGEGDVPQIPDAVVRQMANAYKVPYQMLTGHELPPTDVSPD